MFDFKEISEIFTNSIGKNADEINALGGMTNSNFLITSNDEKFVLRVPGNRSNQIIKRDDEKLNQAIASNFGFNVKTAFFDEVSGIKITEFLSNAITLKPATLRQNSEKIAKILSKIHSSKMEFKNNFNPFLQMKIYLNLVSNETALKFNGFLTALEIFNDLEQKLTKINQKFYAKNTILVPTHGDLVPENILMCNERIFIIDWEYSGLNDPAWDVASLFVESDFSNDEEERFLGLYGADLGLKSKIEIYKSVQDILWTAWSLVKISNGDESYTNYAKKRLKSALERVL
ncbi:choline kinase family protein [Campylobacter mucosalis]|uniref:Choline kinase n=1 Tax=Campylobacter mucosalis CCUG 21559 TaxID=1032067 RepID=A0A6G5QIZ6_9BACT|nr:choline kinase family protein [Campylobacter mucosalis]QCD45640.1 choline kinase [Campylobacter mucosalis CCUG 21559]